MSERFEGLSLPDLVELLHEPVVPPAVPMFPETIAWRIVAVWAIAVAAIVASHALLRWWRNRYRREAAASLLHIEARVAADPTAIADVGALLKRTAITAYSRERVAPLYGDAWADFLRHSCGGDTLVSATAAQLAAVAYRPPADAAVVVEAAHRWIRCHRD